MNMAVSPKGNGSDRRAEIIGDPELRDALEAMIRSKVAPDDVEDVVQATLVDAFASQSAPKDAAELRKWVFGIARHKIADHYRGARRVDLPEEMPESEADSMPQEALDLARWVERALPESVRTHQTLERMSREADGEKLEVIAAEENLPAPRVRQRVSRLRRLLRERWFLATGMLVGVLFLTAGLLMWNAERTPPWIATPSADPSRDAIARAREIRQRGLELCHQEKWVECLRDLDDAKRLDAIGDRASTVEAARQRAELAIDPPPELPLIEPKSEPSAPQKAMPKPEPGAPLVRPTAVPKGNSLDHPLGGKIGDAPRPRLPSKGK
jgi:DNA-directed RNA polymerase specialized sigma24 family protein